MQAEQEQGNDSGGGDGGGMVYRKYRSTYCKELPQWDLYFISKFS